MERSKYAKALSMNLMINSDLVEIRRIQDIIKYHEINQNLLRDKLKQGVLSGYLKRNIEHKIHNNKIIIRGMAQYIIELRSDMKDLQRRHPLNKQKKNDTKKA